jgi:hypothetical protein
MSITAEHYEQLYRDLDTEAARQRDAARAALPCPHCGAADGMDWWGRDVIAAVLMGRERRYPYPEHGFYLCPSDSAEIADRLYTPCLECRRAVGHVPEGYEPLTREQAAEWAGVTH